MDLELNSEQQLLIEAVDRLTDPYRDLTAEQRRAYAVYSDGLGAELDGAGFLDIARESGLGALEAALIVERISRLTATVETAATAIVAPQISAEPLPRPLVLFEEDLVKAARFLPQAKAGVAIRGNEVVVFDIAADNVTPVDSILAFPYGKFVTVPDLASARVLPGVTPESYRAWARVALAVECAGAMRAAVDFTVAYVKERHLFGRALGSFQSVQHRLAQAHTYAAGAQLLAFQAAESGDPLTASLAGSFAQMHIAKVTFDLHQFNGGMGMTNEHSLHLFTFRLRALMAEFGGTDGALLDAANMMWPEAA